MKKSVVAITILGLSFTLAGCSSSSSSNQTVAADCLSVDSAFGSSIISGAESGTGASFVRASAVKSPDFENVFFIAIEFSTKGAGNKVGVFASNALTDGGGIVMAVDPLAQQFTIWPSAHTTDAAISRTDPSVEAAKACLQ